MMTDQILRQQLVNQLTKRQAHMLFEDAVANFPTEQINARIPDAEYTIWHIVEHLRICQWDILDYIINPDYQHPTFPDDLWPAKDATTDLDGWNHSIAQFLADRQALVDIVNDPTNDLYAQIPHAADGHNILREILIIAQHNAYHIGELGGLRQSMRLWRDNTRL